MTGNILVEVAYALPDKQKIIPLEVVEGTTAQEAVVISNIAAHFDGLDVHAPLSLGVFGKAVASGYVLRAGDRVEIYRPLKIDPKEVRKRRAEEAKQRRAAEDA